MTNFLKGLGLLAAALVIQILVSHRVPAIQRTVDLVLLVVVYYGSSGARVGAMFAGAAGGLLEDIWFGDLMGIHGFTKTVIGYILGGLGARFDLTTPIARIIAVLVGTTLDRAVEPLVLLILGQPAGHPDPLELLWRSLGTGLAGALFFSLAGRKRILPV